MFEYFLPNEVFLLKVNSRESYPQGGTTDAGDQICLYAFNNLAYICFCRLSYFNVVFACWDGSDYKSHLQNQV